MVEIMIPAFALGLAAFLALVVLLPEKIEGSSPSERAVKLILMALVGVLVAVAVWFANGGAHAMDRAQ
jgi:hypothetical protein